MCVECKFGKATGVKLWFNVCRYLLDKLTGLDSLQGRNFSRAMNLSQPWSGKAAEESNAEVAKHKPGWKHSWAAALYFDRVLTKYEQQASGDR